MLRSMQLRSGEPREVEAIVQHGRALLGRGIQTAWDRGHLVRNASGYLPAELGHEEIEALLARPPAFGAPVGTPPLQPALGRVGALVETLGAPPVAGDLLAVLLAVEL